MGKKQTYKGFKGSLLQEAVLSHVVQLREPNGIYDYEKAISYSFVNTLALVIDPLDRIEYDISVKTADDIVVYLCDLLGTGEVEKNLSGIDQETSTELLIRIRNLSRLLFAVFCASKGYLANDYIDFDLMENALKYNKLDITQELDILLGMHRILDFLKLPEVTKNFNLKEVQKMSELLKLLKTENNEELLKENIESVFKNTLSKIEFHQPVEEEEIYKLVVQSCNSDFGAVLYLLQERIELLYDFKIVEILLDSFGVVAAGNDLRRKRAFYRGLLTIIGNMKNYDLNMLTEKYISNTDVYVLKWIIFIREVEMLEGSACQNYEPVTDEIAQGKSIETIVPHIYLWAILAPIVPIPSHEDFFKRIARTLISNIPEQAKLNLVKAFNQLVPKCRQTFLNPNNTNYTSSLYYVVYHLIKEMKPEDFSKRGCHAISILLDRLCPMRMVEFILPFMDNDMLQRTKTAICVQYLLKNDKLLTMIRQAGVTDKSTARAGILKRLLDLALGSYQTPYESSSSGRFQFINTTLSFLSSVFAKHISPEELEYFILKMEKTQMEWYQLVILKYGFFQVWECDLPKLEFKAENIESYSDLMQTSFFKPLSFWMGDFMMESFSLLYKKFLTSVCPVMIACALLEQLHVVHSIAQSSADAIHGFIKEICVLPEPNGESGEQPEKSSETLMECVKECLNVTLDKLCLDFGDNEAIGTNGNTGEKFAFLNILKNPAVPEDIRSTISKLAEQKTTYQPYLEIPVEKPPPPMIYSNDRENEGPVIYAKNQKPENAAEDRMAKIREAFFSTNERSERRAGQAPFFCHGLEYKYEEIIFIKMDPEAATRVKAMFIGIKGSNISKYRMNFKISLDVPDNSRGMEVFIYSNDQRVMRNARKEIYRDLQRFKEKVITLRRNQNRQNR
ncbi:unnamed protein product [Auanema sp. JU1783]|nr:unnamed protein product [Auanema sp. JU1783]